MQVLIKLKMLSLQFGLPYPPTHPKMKHKSVDTFQKKIGSRQIGPLADLAANWAPHFLGPNLPFLGKLGPGKLGPGRLGPLAADWAPANWAPADWAPWRQIGPQQIGPR